MSGNDQPVGKYLCLPSLITNTRQTRRCRNSACRTKKIDVSRNSHVLGTVAIAFSDVIISSHGDSGITQVQACRAVRMCRHQNVRFTCARRRYGGVASDIQSRTCTRCSTLSAVGALAQGDAQLCRILPVQVACLKHWK